jgi:hypothetical protein
MDSYVKVSKGVVVANGGRPQLLFILEKINIETTFG